MSVLGGIFEMCLLRLKREWYVLVYTKVELSFFLSFSIILQMYKVLKYTHAL
jgi:hypothetical protein